MYFLNKIYGSNFIKKHSETVMVWNCQNADYSLKNKFIVLFIIMFGTLSFAMWVALAERRWRCSWVVWLLSWHHCATYSSDWCATKTRTCVDSRRRSCRSNRATIHFTTSRKRWRAGAPTYVYLPIPTLPVLYLYHVATVCPSSCQRITEPPE